MEKRLSGVEKHVKTLTDTVSELRKTIGEFQNKRPVNESTQTEKKNTAVLSVQTEFRKNITERGNQIAPACADAKCQTEKDKGALLLEELSKHVLPLLAAADPNWLIEAGNNNMINIENADKHLAAIIKRKFNTQDVVLTISAFAQIVNATFNQQSETEYETEYETDQEATPQQYQPRPPTPQMYLAQGQRPPPRGQYMAQGQRPAMPQQQAAETPQGALYYKIRNGR